MTLNAFNMGRVTNKVLVVQTIEIVLINNNHNDDIKSPFRHFQKFVYFFK